MRAVAMACLVAGGACAHAQQPAQAPEWLAGYWLSCSNGEEVSETWSNPRNGLMAGAGLTTNKGTTSWELFRIAPSAGGISFFATVGRQPTTEFPLSRAASTSDRLVFENLAHDFPQRVIYAREGGMLTARIEGTMNGKTEAMDWRFNRAEFNARCPR